MSRAPGLLAPSILSADFANLESEVQSVERAGADWIHIDVMDGHFVPNLTIGPIVVSSLRAKTKLPLDCHLMVSEPEKWLEAFRKAGASSITVHVEAAKELPAQLKKIRDLGCKAGVSLNPSTPVSELGSVLGLVDLVLVMSVNPGFGGQKFMPIAVDKVRELAGFRASKGYGYVIEVDGGIDATTIPSMRSAGADVFVAGNAIFGKTDRAAAVKELKRAIA